MRKVFIITFSNEVLDMRSRFIAAGAPSEIIEVSSLMKGEEADFIKKVTGQRPAMVIFDGRLPRPFLEHLYEDVFEAIGTFDMDTQLYSTEEPVPYRGVTHSTIPELVATLLQKPS